MFVSAKNFIDRNPLDEYVFVGGYGEKVTTNAEKLLNLLMRRAASRHHVPGAGEW